MDTYNSLVQIGDLISKAVQIPEVVTVILRHLSFSDIKTSRQVCRLWKVEAKRYFEPSAVTRLQIFNYECLHYLLETIYSYNKVSLEGSFSHRPLQIVAWPCQNVLLYMSTLTEMFLQAQKSLSHFNDRVNDLSIHPRNEDFGQDYVTIQRILTFLPNLVKLSITLPMGEMITVIPPEERLKFPNVQSLVLKSQSGFTLYGLLNTRLSEVVLMFESIFDMFPNLHELFLQFDEFKSAYQLHVLRLLGSKDFPNLKILKVKGVLSLLKALENFPLPLEKLSMKLYQHGKKDSEDPPEVEGSVFQSLAPTLQTLELELEVRSFESLGEIQWPKQMPRLKKIKLELNCYDEPQSSEGTSDFFNLKSLYLENPSMFRKRFPVLKNMEFPGSM